MQSMNPVAVGQGAYQFLKRHPIRAAAASGTAEKLAGIVG
jgi:hypothetical protein